MYDAVRLAQKRIGVLVRRAAQLRRALLCGLAFRLGGFSLDRSGAGRLGLDRLNLRAFDARRLHPRGNLGTRVGRRTRRAYYMWLCARARHQHGGAALMLEVAIGEAKTGDGAAEAAVVPLVDVEARLARL